MTELEIETVEILTKRVNTTINTSAKVFEDCDRYIKAAFTIIDPKRTLDPSDKKFVLTVQMLAAKLANNVPDFIDGIMSDIDNGHYFD